MAEFKHSADEAEKLLDEIEFGPSKYSGMTYEEGIAEALRWLLDGYDDDRPEVK